MDKRVPFFFSAFCSMMVGSTVLHTTAGVMLAGVGASAAERVQAVFTAAGAAGFSAPEIAPAGPKAVKVGYQPQASVKAADKDEVLIRIADIVQAQGESGTLERQWVTGLNIPVTTSGNDPLPMKRMQTTGQSAGGTPWTRTAIVVVTDKRYVIFNIEIGDSFNGVAADESGSAIAGRFYRPDNGMMNNEAKALRVKADRTIWAKKFEITTVASAGI